MSSKPSDQIVAQECWVAADAQALWASDQGDEDGTRTTLSAEALQAYLSDIGVASVCVPPELGALYLNVDWDSAELGYVTGRMLSLGFTNLYQGSGWGEGYLVYATYDFAAGTEYDVFAGYEDWADLAGQLRQGDFPPTRQAPLVAIDVLVQSLRFSR